jgi:methylenetetrahydrofolate dehydrogenase (NADP+)/methenyltetrahydrofolate cyclohydrolase
MQLIDGKAASLHIQQKIAFEITKRKEAGLVVPHLAAILVGNDGGSETYVASKMKTCEAVGMGSSLIRYHTTVSETELIAKITELNNDERITGILVQMPLPKHINALNVIMAINPVKDVDGFHPLNTGLMMKGLPCHIPATPQGILLLLEHYKIETDGKHCVVLGRSDIVGKPMSVLMGRAAYPGNCTVTLCHSKTRNIADVCRTADILIAAIGKPEFVTSDFVKPGAVVIDVGTTRVPDISKKSGFALKGDVAFNEVKDKCSFITPVPGGVGPMTIASLMLNTFNSSSLTF